MNILYKYCDQIGAIKILGSLELKLPYTSDVNDPLECSPIFDIPQNKFLLHKSIIQLSKRNNINLPENCENIISNSGFREKLIENATKLQEDFHQRRGCLLSVSKTEQNIVMWAHYAEKHKGIVLGLDFDKMEVNGIKMRSVKYSKRRPRINILDDFSNVSKIERFLEIFVLTKAKEWEYEQELRSIFSVNYLRDLKEKKIASLKKHNGAETWFLRLSPPAIKKIIYGLYTDDGLKATVEKLVNCQELKHVELYQAELSKSYKIKLRQLNRIMKKEYDKGSK
jgi:hypothetical protein